MVAPLIVADGMGVNSTADLCLLHKKGQRPDAILFANTGSEKDETYEYIRVRRAWLKAVDFPDLVIVQNQVKDFKHWPPYHSLGENCLTNGTLPSLAFGFKSCSLKWKVAPQNKWTNLWKPAQDAWARGEKVRKIIGYDYSTADKKRYAHAKGMEDPDYDYFYPLHEQHIDREGCKDIIRSDTLLCKIAAEFGMDPVPIKSACYFCPAAQPAELREYKLWYLRFIVIMEARAFPRLMGHWDQEQIDEYNAMRLAKWEAGERKGKKPKPAQVGDGIKGLWRNGTKGTRDPSKKKPAMMTDFIRDEGLLPADEIDRLIAEAPKTIIDDQQAFENGLEIPAWHDFIEAFTKEDAAGCEGCACGPDLVQLDPVLL